MQFQSEAHILLTKCLNALEPCLIKTQNLCENKDDKFHIKDNIQSMHFYFPSFQMTLTKIYIRLMPCTMLVIFYQPYR